MWITADAMAEGRQRNQWHRMFSFSRAIDTCAVMHVRAHGKSVAPSASEWQGSFLILRTEADFLHQVLAKGRSEHPAQVFTSTLPITRETGEKLFADQEGQTGGVDEFHEVRLLAMCR